MNTKSMIEGAPWKHIIKFAFPVFMGLLLQQLYNTVDTIVVGNFTGEAALSAVGTTASFVFMMLAVATVFLLFGLFQGANHSAVPMAVALVALTLRVVSTYVFRYSQIFGQSIVWWNGIFGFGAGFLIMWTVYFSGMWQSNAQVSE